MTEGDLLKGIASGVDFDDLSYQAQSLLLMTRFRRLSDASMPVPIPPATLAMVMVAFGLMGCDAAIVDTAPPAPSEAVPFEASPGQMRRLTISQYHQIVQDVFGDELTLPPTLEPDQRTAGLIEIGNAEDSISPRGVEQYEEASFLVAEQGIAAADFGCEVLDDGCARRYLTRIGRRLWRRPLAQLEIDELMQVSIRAGEALDGLQTGLGYGLAAMLQSPYFLFRFENGQSGDEFQLSPWELASRLSFFLWNTGPDDALLDAAARGDLAQPDRYRRLLGTMLADPRTRQGVRAMFSDILELDQLDGLRKDPIVFPHISPEVGPSAREETLRLVEWLTFDEPAPYGALFTTRTTFIDRKLASIYGVRAPTREGFGRHEHDVSSERSGILGHVSILALHSHVGSSSATRRGIFVRRTLLCGEIPPPPADVDTSIPEPSPNAPTLRERIRRHLETPSCATCHRRMDPLGLGLENFDALGRYRETDGGAAIDPSGTVDGVYFGSPTAFGQVLASSDRAMRCAARQFYRYAHGRRDSPYERVAIDEIHQDFAESDYHILALLRAVATHPSFRLVAQPRELMP